MKIVLGLTTLLTISYAQANQEFAQVEAWSNWYPIEQEIDANQVCPKVLADFQTVNEQRSYHGELVDNRPVDMKRGTNIDGRTYFALSCRIRIYRRTNRPLTSLLP